MVTADLNQNTDLVGCTKFSFIGCTRTKTLSSLLTDAGPTSGLLLSSSHSLETPPAAAASMQSNLAISRQNILDPRQKSAHLGVNPGVVRLGTALAPGDDAVQLIVTHKGTARVTLNKGGEQRSKPCYSFCALFDV